MGSEVQNLWFKESLMVMLTLKYVLLFELCGSFDIGVVFDIEVCFNSELRWTFDDYSDVEGYFYEDQQQCFAVKRCFKGIFDGIPVDG
ncbi:hypothetical protein NDU88_002405 [Pleurodeles waltl]|uniref:Uncharacterized protein n=1 Tax=Pleurodeles waltl TaxID=8319 RepID=A0AAV7KU30_PLEWA|nr:hypothetical protein NDU88_002405 [Pleurodeles waltl]